MPHKDPDERRRANRERMRLRRAEGTAWIDPDKEAERKKVWYEEQGGKAKLNAARNARKQLSRQQTVAEFYRKVTKK